MKLFTDKDYLEVITTISTAQEALFQLTLASGAMDTESTIRHLEFAKFNAENILIQIDILLKRLS